ncbi:MAG: hypothetical protein WCI18_10750 [Pseudomonadota bacterium]
MKSFVILAFLISNRLIAGELEAKKDGVEVYSDSQKSSVIGMLKKGEKIPSTERKGMYWAVNLKGKPGFVSVMAVQNSSSSGSSAVTNAIKDAVKQGRESEDAGNNRARSTVMGVRGLDDTSDSAFAGNVKPNLRMVYTMEDMVVSSVDLKSLEADVLKEVETLSNKK